MCGFLSNLIVGKHLKSTEFKILSRIRGRARGLVFTPSHFLDLGTREAIDTALTRYVRAGTIRRLARALYDYPRTDPALGILAPSPEAVVIALKGSKNIRIQMSGAHAANALGLTEQVPVRVVYLTDGPSRTVRIGKQTITLPRTTPRTMATADRISGIVIQALQWLRRHNVTQQTIAKLSRRLSNAEERQLI